MNPNDILAQQQTVLFQAMQNQQHLIWLLAIIQIAFFIVGAWVIYMFYARLRDIADELRKIRVTYEMEQDRNTRVTRRSSSVGAGTGDAQYMPKP